MNIFWKHETLSYFRIFFETEKKFKKIEDILTRTFCLRQTKFWKRKLFWNLWESFQNNFFLKTKAYFKVQIFVDNAYIFLEILNSFWKHNNFFKLELFWNSEQLLETKQIWIWELFLKTLNIFWNLWI